jgi:SulP family sulfate permease
VPGSIVALVLGTAAVALFQIPVETIGSKFGGIPQGLPKFQVPALSWPTLQHLFQPALTIALLAAIESLLCATIADGMVDDRHDSNQELMAQGLTNIICPLFGGIAATGPSRGRRPTSRAADVVDTGMVHALTLLVIIFAGAPLAKYIPRRHSARCWERGVAHGRVACLTSGQMAASDALVFFDPVLTGWWT